MQRSPGFDITLTHMTIRGMMKTPEVGDEEDALEQLRDAFVQMMEVVRELAEELSTDALKLTSRFRCARIEVFFTPTEPDEDDEEDEVLETEEKLGVEESLLHAFRLC